MERVGFTIKMVGTMRGTGRITKWTVLASYTMKVVN